MATEGELLQKLLERLGPAPAAAAPPAMYPGMATMMPQPGMMPFGAPMIQGQVQPTGISVPITVPLPDGREITLQLLFGPEHAGPQNLPGFLGAITQQFGQILKAYAPRYQQNGYGNGNGYGNNGYRGGYGGRRRY